MTGKIIDFEGPSDDAFDECCALLGDLLYSLTDEAVLRKVGMTEESLITSVLVNGLAKVFKVYYPDKARRNEMLGIIMSALVRWIEEEEVQE